MVADTSLIAAAVKARSHAYAPYSRFLVGAAVKDEHGQVHAGCNVENAAYPEGTCAEAGAIAAMIMGGGKRITEAAVVGAGDALVTPCGGCRQKLREFGGNDLVIHVCDERGLIKRSFTLGELLPSSFGPDNLA
ncbi:cytidine deaminase [Taklimakanibacter deserti]|uniref:cytidine deaminase n=1 Tax=Taklimakanibacter deserti TaxID=2267839 RepID=UPI000E64B1B4